MGLRVLCVRKVFLRASSGNSPGKERCLLPRWEEGASLPGGTWVWQSIGSGLDLASREPPPSAGRVDGFRHSGAAR